MRDLNDEVMTRICVLASGSKGNAVYVSDGKTAILVDAGLSAVAIERRLRAKDLNAANLDAIVVSHEHADHIQGVGTLSRRYGLPVYINPSTLAAAKSRLGRLFEARNFEGGTGFSIGHLHFHPFSVSHDASDAVGFTIQSGAVKVGIATDLGIATQLVSHHLKGCRLLILEANHDQKMLEKGPYPWHVKQRIQSRVGHLSNEACRDLLGEVYHSGLRHVIVGHMSETNNAPERALSVVREAAPHNRTQFTIASQHVPGDIIVLE